MNTGDPAPESKNLVRTVPIQDLADFFCKGPDSKAFRLRRPTRSLCRTGFSNVSTFLTGSVTVSSLLLAWAFGPWPVLADPCMSQGFSYGR